MAVFLFFMIFNVTKKIKPTFSLHKTLICLRNSVQKGMKFCFMPDDVKNIKKNEET